MVWIVIWSFMAYGMTTILVYGSIFESLRNWIKKHSKFFGTLIGCVMCTSTWVGFFMSIVFGGFINNFVKVEWYTCLFFDGMFTCGVVWALNGIIEFFEEFRLK